MTPKSVQYQYLGTVQLEEINTYDLHAIAISVTVQHVDTQSTARLQTIRFSCLFSPEYQEKKITYTLVQILF